MKMLVDLGEEPLWRRSRALGLAIKPVLDALTTVNQFILRTHKVPPLYKSGVRYENEPDSWDEEHFDAIPVVLKRGWGDCDDLAPWRCAELRNGGEPAKIRIQWKKFDRQGKQILDPRRAWEKKSRKLFHIVVRRYKYNAHKKIWEPGDVEDPSKILGMK